MWRKGLKLTGIVVAAVAMVAPSQVALAGAHTWDVSEVFSNADGTIQFVELHEANGTPGEFHLGGMIVSADVSGKNIAIAANVAAPTTSKYYLLARRPLPTCLAPPLRTRSSRSAACPFSVWPATPYIISVYDAFTFGAVPTDWHSFAEQSDRIGREFPDHYAGQTGSVNAAGAVPGDFDGMATWDLDDYAHAADCLAGTNTPPAPAIGGVTVQQCTDAFDRGPRWRCRSAGLRGFPATHSPVAAGEANCPAPMSLAPGVVRAGGSSGRPFDGICTRRLVRETHDPTRSVHLLMPLLWRR